jgi:hypothetical protein
MRYIFDHQETMRLLRDWCGELPLTVASFFFWNSGTQEQRSQDGLLKALMFEILAQNRDLIPMVFPNQWDYEYIDPIEGQQDSRPSQVSLRRAFEKLRTQEQIRICLFIDGLDEYEGDRDGTYEDIVSFFVRLVDSPTIKICLSSRPWLVFEDAFRRSPSLKLQDLTFNDITRYVNDKINGHERMRELRRFSPQNADNLSLEIVRRASGVFLWVKIAVKSLLAGFTNLDRISDLQRRLSELPLDLESFYRHILINHIQPFYHEESSKLFQIKRTLEYSALRVFNRMPPPPPTVSTLSMAEEMASVIDLSIPKSQSPEDLSVRAREMSARLKSRCGGLLETIRHGNNYSVSYLHRSVREFLELPDIRELLLSRTKSSFNPDESLFKALFLQIKHSRDMGGAFVQSTFTIRWALVYARRAMEANGNSYVSFLDQLDKIIMNQWLSVPRKIRSPSGDVVDLRAEKAHWTNFLDYRHPSKSAVQLNQDNFLSMAVSFGLNKYVEAKLDESPDILIKKRGRPLLDCILFAQDSVDVDMVSILLRHGAQPNKEFCGSSAWQRSLELIQLLLYGNKPLLVVGATERAKERKAWSGIFKLFVEGGAKPNVLCTHIKNTRDLTEQPRYTAYFSTPSRIFSPCGLFPDPKLVEMVTTRGGIQFFESILLQSTDWNDVEEETRRAKVGVAQRLQAILRQQHSKKKTIKGNQTWRSRRKWQYRANYRHSQTG